MPGIEEESFYIFLYACVYLLNFYAAFLPAKGFKEVIYGVTQNDYCCTKFFSHRILIIIVQFVKHDTVLERSFKREETTEISS